MLPYRIGETTSMGWKVLNIEYEYNNQYYSENEFNKLMHKNKQISIKKKQTRELCLNEFKKFMYYFLAVVLLNFLKMLLGI